MSTETKGMTDTETVAHLRKWVKDHHGPWGWPTDACGYEQHIRFVRHRNENWGDPAHPDFNQFVLDYADALEAAHNTKIVSRWIDDLHHW